MTMKILGVSSSTSDGDTTWHATTTDDHGAMYNYSFQIAAEGGPGREGRLEGGRPRLEMGEHRRNRARSGEAMRKKSAAKSAALPSRVAAKVGSLCDLADAAFVEGRFLEAAERYVSAWKLLPAPREQWESGREIVKCVAEACLAAGDVAAAKEALAHAKRHKGADDDQGLAALVKRISGVADRPRARAPKKAKKTTARRPSRPASASSRPKTAKRPPGKKSRAPKRRRSSS